MQIKENGCGMNQAVISVAKNLINLVYPLRCAYCEVDLDPGDGSGVCGFCLSMIRRNPKPHCISCGRSVWSEGVLCGDCGKKRFRFNKAYSACLYESVLKELIHQFKYKGKISLGRVLSKLMIDFAKENPGMMEGINAVSFVPLKDPILMPREFNQSRILAVNIAAGFGLPVVNSLKKTRRTGRQNELSRKERLVNLREAFRVKDGAGISNLKVLLIDDVMTTGATLDECTYALLKGGAKEVRCFTLARGI